MRGDGLDRHAQKLRYMLMIGHLGDAAAEKCE